MSEQSFTATEGQTQFTLTATPAAAWVWVNGLAQDASTWSTSGLVITLTTSLSAGDAVEVYFMEGTVGIAGGPSWVKRSSTSTQTLTASMVNVPFATSVEDESGGDITYSSGVWTINKTTSYSLGGFITAQDTTGQRAQFELEVFINGTGTGFIQSDGYIRNSGSSIDQWTAKLAEEPFLLSATDTIEVRAQRASSLTSTTIVGASSQLWIKEMK